MTTLSSIRRTIDLATGVGTTTYATAAELPTSGLTAGDQAFVTSTGRLYISNSNGWYNVALINQAPYWIEQPDGSYALSTTGLSTVITILAGDSDSTAPSYTATADSDFNQIATITTDSEGADGTRFIVTPIDSENGTAIAGSGTVTFIATDGINQASVVSTFSLAFGMDWLAPTKTIITANTPQANLRFGSQSGVSEDGTYIVGVDHNTTSVFDVFIKSGSSYTHQASFSGSGSTYLGSWGEEPQVYPADYSWGTAIQIDDAGERIVANQMASSVATYGGTIYVFKRTGTSWAQEYSATATTSSGYSVPTVAAISGDGMYVAQGRKFDENAASQSGQVTVWSRSGSTWTEQATFNANPESHDGYFGSSLNFNTDGTYLAVGAAQSVPSGVFYVFTRSGSTWTQQQGPIQPSDYASNNGADAGCSIDIDSDGTTIVLGARHHDGSGGALADSGAIYVFTRSGSTWTQQQGPIFASDANAGAYFGNAVSISKDGDTIAVGAYLAQSTSSSIAGGGSSQNSGKVYIFQRSGSTWSQTVVYDGARNSSNEIIPLAQFGTSVSLSGDGRTLLAGARYYDPVYNGGSSLANSGALVVIN